MPGERTRIALSLVLLCATAGIVFCVFVAFLSRSYAHGQGIKKKMQAQSSGSKLKC